MSRILRRPMFRGGRVNSYGTGIASGLADGGRVGFRTGGSYLTLPEPVTNQPIGRNARGQDVGITGISIADFFKPVTVGPTGFSDYMPGDRLRQAEREKFPMYDEFTEETESDDDGIVRLASLTDDIKIPKSKSEANVEAGLPTSEILPEEPELKKEQVVKTPTVKETEENEVTMTDLERALGLDDARKEYVGDALAAASKAFFEGKGFGAISDAAQVKSKAPEIKRLAGLEEFKAKKAQDLYKTKLEAQLKQKLGTRGSLQKDIEYLSGLSGADRIAALGKLGYKAPSLSAAIKELKVTGQSPDPSTVISLAELYIGPDFKGVVSATEDMAGKSEGTYITEDGTALIIVDEKGNTRVQQL